ncbi:MAG: hypothetical protein ACJAT7_001907 [Psychromonas sp.]|jgi:hypothetical protein
MQQFIDISKAKSKTVAKLNGMAVVKLTVPSELIPHNFHTIYFYLLKYQ